MQQSTIWISYEEYRALTPEARKQGNYGIDCALDQDSSALQLEHSLDVRDYGPDGWGGLLT